MSWRNSGARFSVLGFRCSVFGVRRSVIELVIFLLIVLFNTEGLSAVNYKIYYSANDGGPNWRILTESRQLAVDIGSAGSADSAHAFSQSVLREENNTYTMWYAGYDGSNWRILRANSSDSKNWAKQGVCLNLGPDAAFDSVHMVYPYVIKDGTIYKMWYTAFDGKTHWRIGYAESPDGMSFKNRRIVLDVAGPGSLDSEQVHTPVVLKQGSIYIMYYAGLGGSPSGWRILRATSTDGVNWAKQGLALDLGGPGEPDAKNLLPGSIIYEDGIFKLYYWGHGDVWKILYAVSKNGIDWEKKGVFMDLGPLRSLDFRGMAVPAVVKESKE